MTALSPDIADQIVGEPKLVGRPDVNRKRLARMGWAFTAPALIVVGSLMMSSVAEIAWSDPEVAIPAFLTIMTIPLTYSIANGLAFGFTAFTLLKVLRGKFRQVNWFVYALTALFIVRFIYLAR